MMTPQRQAYFNKCSDKEKSVREQIDIAEQVIRGCKATLNRKRKNHLTQGQIDYSLSVISEAKIIANAYRHELAKIKGMDRVAYPHKIKINKGDYIVNLWRCSSCGDGLCEDDNYCSACGRKILWERVRA